jgi:signal transduction histidine kinase
VVAAYYVVSEALTNVAKYAHADGAGVHVAYEGDDLVVEVTDDGAGGADPKAGSGLSGLAARVEALGGRLHISSPIGVGTALRAEIPVAAA